MSITAYSSPRRRAKRPFFDARHLLGLCVSVLWLSGFNPTAAVAKEKDVLFVSSYQNGTVTRIELDTLSQSIIASGLKRPEDGVCHPKGSFVYFAEPDADRITRFKPDGASPETVMQGAVLGPEGLSTLFHKYDDIYL